MSWYKKDNPDITVDNCSKSQKNYVQVPSSSPIKIATSPSSNKGEEVPSIHGNNHGDDEKMRKLEAKREAIRKHQDFPIIRKRFYYLNELDIFKGFIKGKGNLREITQWLTENYNKLEILAKLGEHDDMLKKQHEKEEQNRKLQMFEKMKMDYEEAKAQESSKNHSENDDSHNSEHSTVDNDIQTIVPGAKPDFHHDELSPIKGRARTKSVVSPQNSPERITSTKVEIKKKISILDKYKFKPKQPTLDRFSNNGGSTSQFEQPQKKRKLVRLSSLNDPTPASTSDLSRSPTPLTPSIGLPTPKFLLPNKSIGFKSKKPRFINDDEEEEEVDELDRLEEKNQAEQKEQKRQEI
jgi:SWI/SNF-related matrix-associated actin-dependent regulator 1 of chromatin subfamily A